jgi:hypothetical protein
MKRLVAMLTVGMAGASALPAWAETYEVTLTRECINVYRVDGLDVII